MEILKSVEAVNTMQKNILFNKFKNHFGQIEGRHVAIWGLSFKPETDDMREAPSLVLINQLIEAGCKISVYDPVAMQECKRRIGNAVKYTSDIYECVKNVDAIFHITEWKEFRIPDWAKIKSLINNDAILIDGRNVFDSANLHGIKYLRIG
jgi:UDPglucose 6-dehydrogenase